MMNQSNDDRRKPLPKAQKLIAIFWPSFLVAGVETILFFTLFDPDIIFYDYNISRLGSYSAGFLLFWLFALIPCILTIYFAKPCKPCNIINTD